MSGARISTIMIKELRQISRDPATLGMLLVVPLFLLLMFGFAINLDTKHIQLAVLDHDKTPVQQGVPPVVPPLRVFRPEDRDRP